MDHKKYQTILWIAFLIVIGVLLLVWPPLLTHAGPDLPSRETPTPTRPPGGGGDEDDKDDKPAGAYIVLQVQSAPVGLWTVVQWQDSAGGWHDVEGWQGTLDEASRKMWWVAPDILGKGPFRWTVYQSQGGQLLAISDTFYLPDSVGKEVRVRMTLSP